MNSIPTERGAQAELPQGIAVAFAGALVEDLARRADIRVLFLKGYTLEHQGIRSPKASSDVDVWVDPQRFDSLVASLESLGWHRRAEALSWSMFITHSLTLVHPRWPCDIDVHSAFPGMMAEPQELFDALWQHHGTEPISSLSSGTAPDRYHHAVFAALHSLRDINESHAQHQLRDISTRVAQWSQRDRDLLREAAIRLHATAAMEELLSLWGVPVELSEQQRQEAQLWDIRSRQNRHTFNWAYAISQARGRQRLVLLGHALFPPRADIEASYPETAGSARLRTQRRMQRYGRAARSLPRVAVDLLRSRKNQSPTAFAAPSTDTFGDQQVADNTSSKPRSSLDETTATEQGSTDSPQQEHLTVPLRAATEQGSFIFSPAHPELPPLFLSLSADDLWQLLVTELRSVPETIQEIRADYDVDETTLREAITDFQAAVEPYLA